MKERKFYWDSRFVKSIELIIDLVLVLAGYITILVIQSGVHTSFMDLLSGEILISNFIFFLTALVFFRVFNTSVIEKGYISTIFSTFFALVFANIFSIVVTFLFDDYEYNSIWLVLVIWVQLFYIGVWKLIFSRFVNRRIKKTAIIVGLKSECEELAKKLISEKRDFIRLKYLACEESEWISEETYELMSKVDQIYLTPNTHERVKQRVIAFCLGNTRKDAILVPKTYHISLVNATPYQINDVLTLKIESLHISLESQMIKRLFDIIVSALGLLILSPFLLLIALVIKVYDGGPVFFRQTRVTKENTEFKIFKFRSMIPDAEKHTGAVQASEKDPRITPLGRIMRATRIDELPQLINVLKGDMSIVGPRALRIEEVEEFVGHNSHFAFRAHVKAGITGLAQIQGKYGTTFEDKLRLDLMYIRTYSFLNDLLLILQTIKVVFDRTSAKGISKDITFDEYIKYYGFSLGSHNENIVKLVRVVK